MARCVQQRDVAGILTAFSDAVNRNSEESIKTFWERVFHIVGKYKYFGDNCTMTFICHFLLESLTDYGCHDYDMVLKIIHVYKFWQNTLIRKEKFDYDPRIPSYSTMISDVIMPLFLDKFKNLPRRICCIQDIYIIFAPGDILMARALLKEGMLTPFNISYYVHYSVTNSGSVFKWALEDALFPLDEFQQYIQESFNQRPKNNLFTNLATITEHYNLRNLEIDKLGRKIHRIHLIVYILKITVLSKKNDPSCAKFAECLLLYFRAVPDPFISKDEVKECLRLVFKNEAYKEDVTQTYSDIYESLYHPDISSRYRPRSLKHLCRCSVRKILMEKRIVFPDLVSNLPVPTVMKHFILRGPECPFY